MWVGGGGGEGGAGEQRMSFSVTRKCFLNIMCYLTRMCSGTKCVILPQAAGLA